MAILVAEDEPDMSDILSYILRRSGHEVIVAFDGDSALKLWRERKPELVILDVGLPRKSGWEVCQTIHCESTVPVLIVSGADDEGDIVRGLNLGAADYVTKPFSPRVLQARINRVLSRSEVPAANGASAIIVGDLRLDPNWRLLACGESTVTLTRLEHSILRVLAIHAGQVVTHQDLVERVWGYKGEGTSYVAKGHVRSLRAKLAKIGSRTTVRVYPGFGYSLDCSP
jgi:two-component system OmpR family response regulator